MHSRDEDDRSHPYLATLTDDGHVDPVVPPAALFLATTLFSNQTLQNPLPTNFTIFSGVCVSKLVRGGVAMSRVLLLRVGERPPSLGLRYRVVH